MSDIIETFGSGSLIQHGPLNKRVYAMKISSEDTGTIIPHIEKLAKENSYTKLFCKVPLWAAPLFKVNGFIFEAYIPNFYNMKTDVFFMSKYFDNERESVNETDQLLKLSDVLYKQKTPAIVPECEEGYSIRRLETTDAKSMATVFSAVFQSYPFPVFDPEYLIETMEEHVQYFGVFEEDKLVGISSAEVDLEAQNAEMTDFAILPESRGKRFSSQLLLAMETEMKKQDVNCLYTIARLNSMPINKLFLSAGYKFSGTLPNNTNISGKIESMNVYFKHVSTII